MRAVYGQIYEDLLAQIEGGEYPYQGFIPSEAELCERYKCSHNTARRAVRLLAQEGYVQPINGKGVRVIYLPADREDFSIGGIETFKEAARRNDFEVVTKVIGLEQEVVTPTFARESGFPEGSTVTHVDRVRMIDGRAQILDRNWYLTELVPDITPEIAADSIFTYLEGTLGMRITTSNRTITMEYATAEDREVLDLLDFDMLAVMENRTFNADGVHFETTQSRHRPDYFSFMTTAVRGY